MGLAEGKRARYFVIAGVFIHALSILQRGFATGGIPLAEKRDNVSFMAFSSALLYLYYSPRGGRNFFWALPAVAMLSIIAVFFRPLNTVPPLQKSVWFYVHMFTYMSSIGFLVMSSAFGINYIMGRDDSNETWQYEGAAYGWILYSISLVAGSIWFYMSYGTYWIWTSRELWNTLLWFYCLLYLHARLMNGLRGTPASLIGISCAPLSLFTYFGVGTVIPSPPVQF